MTDGCRCVTTESTPKPEVVLPRPWFYEGTNERTHGVPVDACIAHVITELWATGLVTLGSCCGHNDPALSGPSLVIENGADPHRYWEALRSDGRQWTLHQWQLVTVKATA